MKINTYMAIETLGERLRALRQDKNLTQIELSECLQVGTTIIGLWEKDKRKPTLYNLIAIATFFDVSIDYLAGLEN